MLEHLNRAAVPYVVSGAFALHAHRDLRNTKDLDLFLPAQAVSGALRHLQEQGFETEIRDPVWLAKAHRDGYYVDLITGMSNGVITVDQSWIERSSHTVVLGVPTRVLAPEELIASKLFVAFRERFDGADVVHVIFGTKGRLDWQRLLGLVGNHWELLLWESCCSTHIIRHVAITCPGRFGAIFWRACVANWLRRFFCARFAAACSTRKCSPLMSGSGASEICYRSSVRREPEYPPPSHPKLIESKSSMGAA